MANVTGVIVKGVGGLYTVVSGDSVYVCRARGKFKIDGVTPLVGDVAHVEITDESANAGYLTSLSGRKNELSRPRAANIDVICIVAALKYPALNLKTLDALIAVCENEVENCEIVLCFNKMDIARDEAERLPKVYAGVYKTIITSASEKFGIDALFDALRGKTCVFSGVSGAGKSSLLNALLPNAAMETGQLSRKIERGRHTTRHAELFRLDKDTFAADTPGFSTIAPEKIPKESLPFCFKEFTPHLGKCRYADCAHITEDGCAVKSALNVTINESRYNNYVELYYDK